MAAERLISVELVYALPEAQDVVSLTVPAGTSVAEAIRFSGIAARHGEIARADTPVGIFGRIVAADAKLQDGDRVEIYRPTKADAKQARRRRAAARG